MHAQNPQSQIPVATPLIYLIGMPCAGKTYWGKRLAEHYKFDFIDLDSYISSKEDLTIPGLFSKYGERGFRDMEIKYLKEIMHDTRACTILACGGGTPCFNNNMELMTETGIVVYLQAGVPHLLHNLNKDTTIRPLLKDKDPQLVLSELLQKRDPVYNKAHFILPAENISLSTFAKIVAICTNRQ